MIRIGYGMKDDRGSTLIEVIISVLIVGIVFVPLMMGLNVALKANRQTENELYAEAVASNCIEAGKAYGSAGMDAIYNTNKKFDIVSTGAVLSKESGEYTVSNISEGTKNYIAKIQIIDNPTYNSGQNDFSGAKSIAGINNAVSIETTQKNASCTYDEFAIQEAITYSKANGQLGSLSDAGYEQIVKSCMESKTITVNINRKPVTDEEHPGKFYVTKSIAYHFNGKHNSDNVFSSSGAGKDCVYNIMESGYMSSAPQNLVVFYTNPNYDTEISGVTTTVQFNKNVDGEAYFYCICAGVSIESESGTSDVTIKLAGDADFITGTDTSVEPAKEYKKVKIYSNEIKSGGSDTNFDTFADLGAAKGSVKQNRIYDIEVKVFNTLDTTEPVVTKKSTIIESK